MKNLLLLSLALFSLSAFASTTLKFSAQGKDLGSVDQKELFNENIALRRGQVKKIPVTEWTGRANSQALSYEVTAAISPDNRSNIRATVKAIVTDAAGAAPVELFTETKTIDFTFGAAKTLVFEAQQDGVMLNQSIDFKALR